jgi:hypothetical protein
MSKGKIRPGENDEPEGTEGAHGLSPDLQQHIGNRLRALYDGVVNEPIPDRLMMLLSKLDSQEDSPDRPANGDRPL